MQSCDKMATPSINPTMKITSRNLGDADQSSNLNLNTSSDSKKQTSEPRTKRSNRRYNWTKKKKKSKQSQAKENDNDNAANETDRSSTQSNVPSKATSVTKIPGLQLPGVKQIPEAADSAAWSGSSPRMDVSLPSATNTTKSGIDQAVKSKTSKPRNRNRKAYNGKGIGKEFSSQTQQLELAASPALEFGVSAMIPPDNSSSELPLSSTPPKTLPSGDVRPLKSSVLRNAAPKLNCDMKPGSKTLSLHTYAAHFNSFCKAYMSKSGCWDYYCDKIHDEDKRAASQAFRGRKGQTRRKKQPTSTVKDWQGDDDIGYFQPSAASIPATSFPVLNVKDSCCTPSPHQKPPSESEKLTDYKDAVSAGIPKPVKKAVTAPLKKPLKWDKGELTDWAEKNLSPETVRKYIRYFNVGKIPLQSIKVTLKPDDQKFQRFPELPGELRNKIWKSALRQAGDEVTVRYHSTNEGCFIAPRKAYRPLLFVNQESRSLALAFWPCRLQTKTSPAMVRIRFEYDRLFVHNDGTYDFTPMLQSIDCLERDKIRYLSMPLKHWLIDRSKISFALSKCGGLKKVWFVVGDATEDTTWVEKSFQTADRLLRKIQKELDVAWKEEWKEKDPSRSLKVPDVRFKVIDALEARYLKIDNFKWI